MNSKLQVLTGVARGRKLALPADTRPTSARAKIALFNMLRSLGLPDNLTVWDAFSGSASIGIEFLSQFNPKYVIFTERNPRTAEIIRRNLVGFDANRYKIDVADAAARLTKYAPDTDIVFIDPPYADAETGPRFLSGFMAAAAPCAIAILETESRDEIALPVGCAILRDKVYGRARFLIIKKERA